MGAGHLFMGTMSRKAQKNKAPEETMTTELDQGLTPLLPHETVHQRTKGPKPQIAQPLLAQGPTAAPQECHPTELAASFSQQDYVGTDGGSVIIGAWAAR